jgi:MFS family permease
VFLFSAWLFFGLQIWCASAHTFGSLVAARILSGFVAATGEALCSSINADLFFLHERGWWMGVYQFTAAIGSSIGGIITGFAVHSLGWRWHFWVSLFRWVNVSARRYSPGSHCNYDSFILPRDKIRAEI